MSEKRFSDLRPSITGTLIPGAGTNEITFDCPKCGPPFRVYVRANFGGPADPAKAVWAWSVEDGEITLSPSIHNHHHGRQLCGWHGSITKGVVHE